MFSVSIVSKSTIMEARTGFENLEIDQGHGFFVYIIYWDRQVTQSSESGIENQDHAVRKRPLLISHSS